MRSNYRFSIGIVIMFFLIVGVVLPFFSIMIGSMFSAYFFIIVGILLTTIFLYGIGVDYYTKPVVEIKKEYFSYSFKKKGTKANMVKIDKNGIYTGYKEINGKRDFFDFKTFNFNEIEKIQIACQFDDNASCFIFYTGNEVFFIDWRDDYKDVIEKILKMALKDKWDEVFDENKKVPREEFVKIFYQ